MHRYTHGCTSHAPLYPGCTSYQGVPLYSRFTVGHTPLCAGFLPCFRLVLTPRVYSRFTVGEHFLLPFITVSAPFRQFLLFPRGLHWG